MSKNPKETSPKVASKASELGRKSTSKEVRQVAMSALSQARLKGGKKK